MYKSTGYALILSLLLSACGGGGGSSSSPAAVIDGSVTPDNFLRFISLSVDNNSEAYVAAYYRTVDPFNERTTLAGYKRANGFDSATEVIHATFRDQRDLGYGRDMFAWRRPDGCGFAIFADNYVVKLEPGDASDYGPLNLEAAVQQDRRYLIGTNAIEFTPEDPNDTTCSSPKIAKFYTFTVPDANGTQHRRLLADLDGRGAKAVPTACFVCHGGAMHPLRQDGSFDPVALKSPKMNVLEVDTLGFSREPGYGRADQEANIKRVNQLVYESYTEAGTRDDVAGDRNTVASDQANWHAGFSLDLLSNAYADISADPAQEADPNYNANYIPAGWEQTNARPAGVETLYKRVVKPHCIVCHTLRGTKVANTNNAGTPNSVSFSSFERFKNYNDLIIDYVYRRGAMPRSLINYSQFWATNGNGDAELPGLLASFLDGFDVFDANGRIVAPKRAVAIPGGNRVAPSPVALDASASQLSAAYRWRIVSSTDPSATLTDADAPVATLIAANNSSAQIELITSNANGDSQPALLSVLIDNSMKAAPDFLTDIVPILVDAGCAGCHTSSSTSANRIVGIPVYYDIADDRNDLYRRVLARVDLIDPANSLLLRKPTNGVIHGGSKRLDPDISVRDTSNKQGLFYHTMLNWIRAGAPCGDPNDPMCR